MNAALSLHIESIALPFTNESEARLVAQNMTVALEQLFREDQQADRHWHSSIQNLSIELPQNRGASDTGSWLAQALRDRLVVEDDTV